MPNLAIILSFKGTNKTKKRILHLFKALFFFIWLPNVRQCIIIFIIVFLVLRLSNRIFNFYFPH